MKKHLALRMISTLLVVIMLLAQIPAVMVTAEEAVPTTTVSDAGEFLTFLNTLAADNDYDGQIVQLSDNIDLSGKTLPYIPETNYFKGTFDGQGHTISNAKLVAGENNNISLFGSLGTGAVLQNFTLEGAVLSYSTAAATDAIKTNYGLLAATVAGTDYSDASSTIINNVTVKDSTVGSSTTAYVGYVGGLVGSVASSGKLMITGCDIAVTVNVSTGTMAGDSSSANNKAGFGGVVGYSAGAININNSYFASTVSHANTKGGKIYVGGIVGYGDSSSVTFTNSINNTSVTAANGICIGGFAGHIREGNLSISSSMYLGSITLTGSADRAGALVGMVQKVNITAINTLIGGSISKNTGTKYSISAIVPSINKQSAYTIALTDVLVQTDLSGAGEYAIVFTGLYNGGTADEAEKEIADPVCTNVYYNVGEKIGLTADNNRTVFTNVAPSGASKWDTSSDLGEGWVASGAFINSKSSVVPVGVIDLAEKKLATATDDGISLRIIGKQTQTNKTNPAKTDVRFVAVVKGNDNLFINNLALGMKLTLSYTDPATQQKVSANDVYYVTKGYRQLNDTGVFGGVVNASDYGGSFFVTLIVSDIPSNAIEDLNIAVTPFVQAPDETDPTKGGEMTAGAQKSYHLSDAALRVMSFNVQQDLDKWTDADDNFGEGKGVITKEKRIAAVNQQIYDYAPDLLGLQEDNTWEEHLTLNSNGYTMYHTKTKTKENRIYVKDELLPYIVASGSNRLSGKDNQVALTIADLTTEGSPYKMTDEELAFLNLATKQEDGTYTYVTDNTKLHTSYEYNVYTNAEHTSFETNKHAENGTAAKGYLVERRGMNYVVLSLGGGYVIYVNTHLQHRSQTGLANGYYGATDKAALDSPLQTVRSYERAKSIELLQDYINELKMLYPDAEVVITGDMNDMELKTANASNTQLQTGSFTPTEMYKTFTQTLGYQDTKLLALKNGCFVGDAGTWNNSVSSQTRKTNGSRLDYCFITGGLTVVKHNNTDGSTEIDEKTYYTSDHCPIVIDLKLRYTANDLTIKDTDDDTGYGQLNPPISKE